MKHRLVEESRLRMRRQKSNLGLESDGEGESGASFSCSSSSSLSGSGVRETSSSSTFNSFAHHSSLQESTYENDDTVLSAPAFQRCVKKSETIFLHSYSRDDHSPFFSSPYNALMLLFISIVSIFAFATLILEMKEEHERTSHPPQP